MRLQLRASSPPEPQSHRATKHRKLCETRSMPADGQPSLFINLVTSASQNHRTESQERKSLQRHQLLSVYEEPSDLTLTTMRPFPLIDHSSTTPANRGHLPAISRRKWQHIYSAAQRSRKNPVELCKKPPGHDFITRRWFDNSAERSHLLATSLRRVSSQPGLLDLQAEHT